MLDRIPLRLVPTDLGYGRTPGAANGMGCYSYAQIPSVSMPGGEALAMNCVTVFRARPVDTGGTFQPREIITRTYLMNLYHAFLIVSVVTEPGELWKPETAMLTADRDVDKSEVSPLKTPFNGTGAISALRRADAFVFWR